jgi:fucose 4-O-acetylase-like acetyltransferase
MTGESGIAPDAQKSEPKPTGARLDWVDTAKGIGILLVVIAHAWTRGAVRDFIYAFHMPLFFLLSGYMSKPRATADFLPKQLRAMAVPYAAFLICLVLFDLGFEALRGNHPVFQSWQDGLWRMLVGGSELRGPFTIFWFVPALFFARIIWNSVALMVPDPRDWRWAMFAGACLVAGVIMGWMSDFSPLGLLTVPVVVALLWLGALWRTVENDRLLILLAFPASAVLLLCISMVRALPLNMKVGDYGFPPVSLLLAVGLSLCACAVARNIPGARLRNILGALGRMSLVIMYVHVAVIHYATPYMARPWRFLLALMLSVAIAHLLEKWVFTRRIFLGQG